MIHIAWPIAGVTWIIFAGERIWDDVQVLLHGEKADRLMGGNALATGEAAWLLFGVFFTLLALRVPVAVALGIACLPPLLIEDRLWPMILVQETFNSYNSFILLAVPFFLLAANLMTAGGITDRLVTLSRDHWSGTCRAASRRSTSCSRVFFAGISGSSTADAASQGKLFIEAQIKEGYDAQLLGRHHRRLRRAGGGHPAVDPDDRLGRRADHLDRRAVPGRHHARACCWRGVQMGTVHVYAKAAPLPDLSQGRPGASWRYALFISIPALMTPFIIIGGKIFGWFTADRGRLHRRALRAGAVPAGLPRDGLRGLYSAFSETGRFAAITLFCVGTASAFGWLLAFYKIPEALLAGVSAWEMGPIAAGFFVAAVFLVVGCFLDAIPAIIIVGTILQPITAAAGMHPVHFAMIGIVSLAFGLVTPPYGLCLLICCSIANLRLVDVLKDVCIMLLPMLGVLVPADPLARHGAAAAAAARAGLPEVARD